MRTTIEIPDNLIKEAMKLTKIETKTELVKVALENLIQKEKVKDLSKYFGKIELDIDTRDIRDRGNGIN
ncbi:MAG: type II toxin-antitoxin system VapB family antitoxin [Spirochaetales bacterium]|nr:type II toxin-antitoxin system VapB family antitoxin [Spirochaetales bacterium]